MNRKLIIAAGALSAAAVGFVLLRRSDRGDESTPVRRLDTATIDQLKTLSDTVANGREATLAAFDALEGSEHEALDAKALQAIERISHEYAQLRPSLPNVVHELGDAIVGRYEAAQMQLLSFAINRKNRETDGGQIATETRDGKSFAQDSGELVERLASAIATKRI